MTTTKLPPAPPVPPDLDTPPDPEALIEEARRRARRRRALYALAALLAAGAAVAGFAGFRGGGGRTPLTSTSAPPPASPTGSARSGRAFGNGPLAVVNAPVVDAPDRIVLVGQHGHLIRTLPICRPPRCGAIESAAWSPDGNTLAYGTMGGPGGAYAPRDGLHLLDLDTGHDRLLIQTWAHWQDLAWSPNGRKLAYVADASVYALEVAHPARVTAVRKNATSPSWSPGGRLIAYDRCAGGRASGIDVARADGSQVRHLTRVGCSAAWSPDGSRIAYRVWCGIKVVTPTGRDLTPPSVWRCQHVGVAGAPTWSPDGRLIAIGGDGVFVMRRNGSGLTKIWDQPAQRPAWRPVARR
jgi:hypothetical protein